MKPNIILILVMGGIILIMGASSHPTSKEPLTYEEIIDQVNAEYGDGGVLQFYSLQGIKDYFEIVHIQTQELTSIGFKTAILDL